MKISKLLLSSIAVSAFAGAVVAGNAVTAVSDILTRDSEVKFTDLGSVKTAATVDGKAFYADYQDTLTIKGLPEDVYSVEVVTADATYKHGVFRLMNDPAVGESGGYTTTKSAMIDAGNISKKITAVYPYYAANVENSNKLGAYLEPNKGTISLSVTEHCDADVVYKMSYNVVGYMPGMSFVNNGDVAGVNASEKVLYLSDTKKSFDEAQDIVTSKKIIFTKATVDTTYFVMAGYAGENYSQCAPKVKEIKFAGKENPSQISCKIEKVAATDAKVKYVNAAGEAITGVSYQQYWQTSAAGFEGQLYRAIVTYAPEVGGHFVDATVVITDDLGLNTLNLRVNAADMQIYTDFEGVDFPQEGGNGRITISCTGFEGAEINQGKNIKAYMKSQLEYSPMQPSPFKLHFVSSYSDVYPVTYSNPINAHSTIYLDYECEPVSDNDITSVEEDYIVIEVSDKKIEIPVTRTNPNIRVVKECDEIVFGENVDDVTKEIAYVVTNYMHYYNVNDYSVYTDADAFKVNEVKRIREGILIMPNMDYEATITVLYQPLCDTKEYTGNLYIETKKTGDIVKVPLRGIAKVNAKGYTGVENVAGAAKAGAIYSIGGAALGGNAKGIVIENGKAVLK